MKKLLSIALLILIVSSVSAQFGMPYSKSASDGRYFKITDGVLGYTAAQVDSATVNKFKRDVRYLSGINYLFPIVANNFGMGSTGIAMSNGVGYYSTYICDETRILTSVTFGFSTQGVYTADGAKYNGIVVFRENITTGDLTEIGRTTNDGDIWKGALSTAHVKSFVAGIPVVKGDVIKVAAVLNSSGAPATAPLMLTFSTAYSSLHLFTGTRLIASKNGIDDFTNVNVSTLSTGGTCYAFWLK